jgi:hypothetical protein
VYGWSAFGDLGMRQVSIGTVHACGHEAYLHLIACMFNQLNT